MLGHLHPSNCSLEESVKADYKNLYCSICASIREKNHLGYTFLINNELTLVLLSLRNYYEPISGKTPCPSSLFTLKNPISKHKIIEKAGDLSVLLGWIKSEDWKADKGNFLTKIINHNFVKKAHPLLEKTSTTFQKTIENYVELTKTDNKDFAFVKSQSALLSRALLLELSLDCYIPEAHLKPLLDLFHHAGILINVIDHLLDLDKDIQKKQYNPILENTKNTEEIVKNYYQLRQDFNFHIQKSNEILKFIQQYEISNSTFYTAFSQSINRMKKEVQQKKPQMIQFFEKDNPSAKYSNLTFVKNDCVTGPDCNSIDYSPFLKNELCESCCESCCKSDACKNCCEGSCEQCFGEGCCCKSCQCNCNNCCECGCCQDCINNTCNSCQNLCCCCDWCCVDIAGAGTNSILPSNFSTEEAELFKKIIGDNLQTLEQKEDSLQKLLQGKNPNFDELINELGKIKAEKDTLTQQLNEINKFVQPDSLNNDSLTK